MKHNKLTKVERQFVENALPGLYVPDDPSRWSALRECMMIKQFWRV